MRLMIIPELEYEEFCVIRDAILDNVPFAIIRETYRPQRKEAQFYWWDTDYIPPCLEQYILRPPKHREPVEQLHKELIQALKIVRAKREED